MTRSVLFVVLLAGCGVLGCGSSTTPGPLPGSWTQSWIGEDGLERIGTDFESEPLTTSKVR